MDVGVGEDLHGIVTFEHHLGGTIKNDETSIAPVVNILPYRDGREGNRLEVLERNMA